MCCNLKLEHFDGSSQTEQCKSFEMTRNGGACGTSASILRHVLDRLRFIKHTLRRRYVSHARKHRMRPQMYLLPVTNIYWRLSATRPLVRYALIYEAWPSWIRNIYHNLSGTWRQIQIKNKIANLIKVTFIWSQSKNSIDRGNDCEF